jgi:hypothetical protein
MKTESLINHFGGRFIVLIIIPLISIGISFGFVFSISDLGIGENIFWSIMLAIFLFSLITILRGFILLKITGNSSLPLEYKSYKIEVENNEVYEFKGAKLSTKLFTSDSPKHFGSLDCHNIRELYKTEKGKYIEVKKVEPGFSYVSPRSEVTIFKSADDLFKDHLLYYENSGDRSIIKYFKQAMTYDDKDLKKYEAIINKARNKPQPKMKIIKID